MKIPFYVSVAASGLCLLLSIIVLAVGTSNQSLQVEVQKQQQELQKQQEQINTGSQIQQKVGPALLQDMGQVSVKNEKMKALLSKHGYTLQMPATPAPGAAGTATPAPASTDAVPALR